MWIFTLIIIIIKNSDLTKHCLDKNYCVDLITPINQPNNSTPTFLFGVGSWADKYGSQISLKYFIFYKDHLCGA